VVDYLQLHGYVVETAEPGELWQLERADGLRILKAHPDSHLGWRILVELDRPENIAELITQSVQGSARFSELVPPSFRDRIMREVTAWTEEEPPTVEPATEDTSLDFHGSLTP
jgi:hypothetical protein